MTSTFDLSDIKTDPWVIRYIDNIHSNSGLLEPLILNLLLLFIQIKYDDDDDDDLDADTHTDTVWQTERPSACVTKLPTGRVT